MSCPSCEAGLFFSPGKSVALLKFLSSDRASSERRSNTLDCPRRSFDNSLLLSLVLLDCVEGQVDGGDGG